MHSRKNFIQAYYSMMKEFFLEVTDEYPWLTPENYWEEISKPVPFSGLHLEKLESKLGIPFPDTFRDFYLHSRSLENWFDFSGGQIVGNLEESPLKKLSEVLFETNDSENMRSLGLIPFGMYNDGWYICLDTSQNAKNPPVVLFEMFFPDSFEKAKSHKNWFSSFEHFLNCMAAWMNGQGQEAFNEIDPENHFRNAYSYW